MNWQWLSIGIVFGIFIVFAFLLLLSWWRIRKEKRLTLKVRHELLSFDSHEAIPVGKVVDIIVRPQTPFRGERFVVPSDIANNFRILDIKIGLKSQICDSILAIHFTEDVITTHFVTDVVKIAQDFKIVVENISTQPCRFRAVFIGTSVQ